MVLRGSVALYNDFFYRNCLEELVIDFSSKMCALWLVEEMVSYIYCKSYTGFQHR